MASRKVALGVVVLLGSLCISRPASAAPILGGSLIATGGDVTVTYVADFAGDVSQLYLFQVGSDVVFAPGSLIFQNGGSGSNSAGDTFLLDASIWGIDAGEELIFALVNTDENETNDGAGGLLNYGTYFTGPASRNPDGAAHAVLVPSPYDGVDVSYQTLFALAGLTTQTVVGFEDRPDCTPLDVVCRGELGGGAAEIQADFDYDDLIYAFSDVRAVEQSAPEPASVLLFGAGAAAFLARRRKQNNAR